MALSDTMNGLQKAIAAKEDEAKKLWADFESARKSLEGTDVDMTDLGDPKAKAVLDAADEALKPYSKAAEEVKDLQSRFNRLALMQADGGEKTGNPRQLTEHDRDLTLVQAIAEEFGFGKKAISSERYKQLKEAGAFADGSEFPLKGEQLGDALTVRQTKSLLTGQIPAQGGVANVPERLPGIFDLPRVALGIFDLLTIGATGERSVEFMRILNRTIRAAETSEAMSAAPIDGTTVTAARGGLAPESDITFERATESVKAIKHWMPGTRDQLADEPFFETLLDAEMLDGVRRRAETQTVKGDGTGENIRGILRTPGIASYQQGTVVTDEPLVDALHRSFTMLRLIGFNPTGTAIYPTDWENVRLSKDRNGNYIWGPPSQAAAETVFGVPVVQTIAVPEGNPVTAEWRRGMFLVREGARTLVSDSHEDFFLRGLLAILAQMRGVLVIPRPQAFAETKAA